MAKRKVGRKRMRGSGFFGDLYDGFKTVLSKANDIARSTGAISKIATATGHPEIGAVSGALGYGRMRGSGRRSARKVILT